MSNLDLELQRFKSVTKSKVELSDRCMDILVNSLSKRTLKEGEFFSQELSRTKELAYIVEGIVRIYSIDDEGYEWNHSILSKNEFIMASINPNIPSPVSIQAITPLKIIYIPYTEFSKLARAYDELGNLYQTIISEYLERESNRNKFLMTKKSSERLSYFQRQFENIIDQIPHEHIAKYIGVSEDKLDALLVNI